MGIYRPTEQNRARSLDDMLSDAEHEHLLDCPNADRVIRVGSTFLDIILCFLMISGITHISNAIGNVAPRFLVNHGPQGLTPEQVQAGIFYVAWVFKLMLGYVYIVWTVAVFGGSPAKLLLGLRVMDASSGQKLSIPRAVLREIFGKGLCIALGGGGFFLSAFRSDRRALHDLLSNSVVKKVHGNP